MRRIPTAGLTLLLCAASPALAQDRPVPPTADCVKWQKAVLSSQAPTTRLYRTADRVQEFSPIVRLDYNPARRTLITDQSGR
jgi:hypothetical protein